MIDKFSGVPLICISILLVWCRFIQNNSQLFSQELSVQAAIERMVVADGLTVSLVASEPLVRQPVAIEFDDRGRLWVIQYLQYPNPEGLERVSVDRYSRTIYDRIPEPPPHGPRGADRITILEDTNGDGVMDSSRDFVDGLNLATGIAFGHGGVFVLNVPYLLFYPDRDRDDLPDSDPEVLLSGFGMEDAHSVANSLTWGPDGWLYGCQGSTVTANIRGIRFQQGVWRYHPQWDRFELFCEGGGNSWGLDFDATGELLYSTNFGGHVILHGVQGGYFTKAFAKHGPLQNPFAYGYFDHAAHEDFRGGHVTVGGIIYQADTLPSHFRGKLIAADLLGHNIYWHEVIEQSSTFRTRHAGELLISNHSWFAPCDVTVGPDGAVYVADWHDARTAHPDPDADWDRSNGRIYRIAPEDHPRSMPDFSAMSLEQLYRLHFDSNQWMIRRARQELIRRQDQTLIPDFKLLCHQDRSEHLALEALWTLHALGSFNEELACELLRSPYAGVRRWVVRLLGDQSYCGIREISDQLAHQLDLLAEQEPSINVRQQLASTAARLPASQALPIINANIIRDIDSADARMPLLWWWAVERHSLTGRDQVLSRFTRDTIWKSRLGREFLLPRLVRRYAAEATVAGLDSLVRLLKSAPNQESLDELWPSVLAGWQEQQDEDPSLFRHTIASHHPLSSMAAEAWAASPDDLVLARLAAELRYAPAMNWIRENAFDPVVDEAKRTSLLQLMSQLNDISHLSSAMALLQSESVTPLRVAALSIIGRSEESETWQQLLEILERENTPEVSQRILEVLFRRPESARRVLDRVESGTVNSSDIPIELLQSLDWSLELEAEAIVTKHWGKLGGQSAGELLAEMRRLSNDLRADSGRADQGRTVFLKHCASCHELFGEGVKIGPDLTSANRKDQDFLLSSLVDPNNFIRSEYVSLIVHTYDGRIISGLPVERGPLGMTLIRADGQPIHISTDEIEEMRTSPVSLMPRDLYKQLSPQELRDLFAYLQSD